jgi:DNA-binding beta-propeller fold protein YncE
MTPRSFFVHAVSLAVLPVCVWAQTAPKAALLALSKQDHTLAIVDPADLKVLAQIPVGDDPHEVVASTDGKTAYVSNYGFGAFHTLTAIDLVGQKPLPVIDLGALRGPHGLNFVAGKVWFTAEAAKAIGSYDPSTGKIDWIMGTGQNRTHMLYVFPDAKHILTANVNSSTVTILEKTEGRVGGGAEGFDVSPDGKEAWVANAWDGTVSVIGIAGKAVVATLPANVTGANRLKFSPDGKLVLITAGSALVVFDPASRKELKRLTTVHGTGGIQMQPDGARAYVACGRDGYVAVIDLKTLEMVGRVNIAGPDGLAWAVRQD